MKRYIIFLILFLIPFNVLARSKTSCDYTLLSKLKGLANNVNISYTYELNDDKVKFKIDFTNLNDDIYFIDNKSKIKYYYSDTNNGIISIDNYSSGYASFKFYSNNSECLDELLVIKNVNLPYYNKYYKYDECKGLKNINICQKWYKYDGGYSDFQEDILNYKKQLNNDSIIEKNVSNTLFDKFVSFFLSYYYIVMPALIVIVLGIIYLFKYISFKRNRFKI